MQSLLCLISWELNLIATSRQWPHVTAFDPLKWFKAHFKRIQFWNLSSFWNQKALSTLNIYTAVSQQSYHVHQTFGNLTSSINTRLPLLTEEDYNFWKSQISKFSKKWRILQKWPISRNVFKPTIKFDGAFISIWIH